jgi:hypothetical protein
MPLSQINSASIEDGAVAPGDLSTGAPYWTSAGNLGVGTTSPSAKFAVTSSANSPSAVFTDATQSTLTIKHEAGNLLTYDTGGTAIQRWVLNGSEGMRIDPSGNLTVTGTITGSNTGGLGVGQTWTNVTSTRNGGTTYTNSTGKPISVLIVGVYSSGTGVVSVNVGGVLAGTSQYAVNAGWLVVCTTIVPPSATYIATFTGSTKNGWYELR